MSPALQSRLDAFFASTITDLQEFVKTSGVKVVGGNTTAPFEV
jgi:hypothetical protein